MAQDDYYYEIQLTNKQLVFYFLAGATGLILSFLAGVMVGRGVDAATGDVQAAHPIREDRIVAEETPRPSPAPSQGFGYAQRLESEKPEEDLEKASPDGTPGKKGKKKAESPKPSEGNKPSPKTADATKPSPKPADATKPSPKPEVTAEVSPKPARPESPRPEPSTRIAEVETRPSAPPRADGVGAYSIQVGAFKDKASAEGVVTKLKAKNFPAFLVPPESADGLFNVRVGTYQAKPEAERIEKRLRDEEKFKPFIVHQ